MFGVAMLLLPFVPGSRAHRQLRPPVDSRRSHVSFQPGELAKIALAVFFAGYLVERRELLAMATWKVGPLYLPEPRHLGPLVVAWLMSLGIMTMQQRPGQFAAVLRPVRRDGVGRHRTTELRRDRRRPVRGRRVLRVDPVRSRATARRHLARPVGRPAKARATRSSRASTPWLAVVSPERASDSVTRRASPRPRTTSSSPRSARNSACSAHQRCSSPSC